jgi:hypothetical protein
MVLEEASMMRERMIEYGRSIGWTVGWEREGELQMSSWSYCISGLSNV